MQTVIQFSLTRHKRFIKNTFKNNSVWHSTKLYAMNTSKHFRLTWHNTVPYEYIESALFWHGIKLHVMSRNFSESKILRFYLNIEYQILELCSFCVFLKIIKYLMAKQNVSLAIHDFSDLKRFANNGKIRCSIKFLLIWYIKTL